jgi:hypothetical protein
MVKEEILSDVERQIILRIMHYYMVIGSVRGVQLSEVVRKLEGVDKQIVVRTLVHGEEA